MASQSRSAQLQVLFESALQAYQRTTGIALAQHPLAVNLQSGHSIHDITTLLQGQTQAFSDSRQRDKMMGAIKNTVSFLNPLSDAVGLVRQKHCRRVPSF
jgi:hypothetical protein